MKYFLNCLSDRLSKKTATNLTGYTNCSEIMVKSSGHFMVDFSNTTPMKCQETRKREKKMKHKLNRKNG